MAQGQRPEARFSGRLWRAAAVDPVSRCARRRAHRDHPLPARLSRRRSRPYRARHASRLDPGRAPSAAKGGSRRCRPCRQHGRQLLCRRGRGDLAADGAAPRAGRAVGPVRRERTDGRSVGAARPRGAGLVVRRSRALEGEPEGANAPEWPIEQVRANEAAARIFWPLCNTRLERRLPLITAPTLLIRGEQDRVLPMSYVERFAQAVRGRSEIRTIPGAGHLAELDKPQEVAAAILAWTA